MTDEQQIIKLFNNIFEKPEFKRNQTFEADCEIIETSNGILALSSDTLKEELDMGLIKAPYDIGWYACMMTISDVMASGSRVLGLLTNLTLPKNMTEEELKQMANGMQDCCKKHETFILGGDTNFSEFMSLSSFGVGIPVDRPVTRKGLKEGDLIYITKGVGLGNATALANKLELDLNLYDRLPSLIPGLPSIINKYAHCTIDTSDGLLHGLSDLLEQNPGMGIDIYEFGIPYHPLIQELSSQFSIPNIVFAGGEVGDYGIIMAVNADEKVAFESICNDYNLCCIGKVVKDSRLLIDGKQIELPTKLLQLNRNNLEKYIQILTNVLT